MTANAFLVSLVQGASAPGLASPLLGITTQGNATVEHHSAPIAQARTNRLLAELPQADWLRISAGLEPVQLKLGMTLYESGGQLDYVYFPTTSIVSLLYVLADGGSAEIAVVGNDGVVGISLFMGGETTPNRAVVQSAGTAYRLKAAVMKAEFARGGDLQHLLLRYTQALINQMSMTAVCNRHHSIEQQLCRWLLLSLDRMRTTELLMTQELIANMLGVRREGVTEAAGHLQQAGLIQYRRGHINVLDRKGLEARSCECYSVVRRETDRLFPPAQSGANSAAVTENTLQSRPQRIPLRLAAG